MTLDFPRGSFWGVGGGFWVDFGGVSGVSVLCWSEFWVLFGGSGLHCGCICGGRRVVGLMWLREVLVVCVNLM